jgi:hypothetical protein
MSARIATLGIFLALLPVGVEVPGALDSTDASESETRLSLGLGAGQYAVVARGCEGNVLREQAMRYRDAGAGLEHRFSGPGVIGVRAGVLREEVEGDSILILEVQDRTNAYVNPYVAWEGRRVGLGLGWVAAREEFPSGGGDLVKMPVSAHLRVGNPRGFAVAMHLMESMPLYSGGGEFELLAEIQKTRADFRVGMSGPGPFDRGGAIFHGGYRVAPGTRLELQMRIGQAASTTEYGLGLRLDQTLHRGR